MMIALEGVPYRLAEPRATGTKPVIESKHQLRDTYAGRSSIISGELQTGGIVYVYIWLECSYDPPEGHSGQTGYIIRTPRTVMI